MGKKIFESLMKELNIKEDDTLAVSVSSDVYPTPKATLLRQLLTRGITIHHHTFYKVCKLSIADTTRIIGYGVLGFTIYKPVRAGALVEIK